MKIKNYVRIIALTLTFLIISLPIAVAEEFNRVYDANGNLISDGKYYREYNGLNQLFRVRLGNTSISPILEEYKWHPIEERIVIKKVFSNGVLNYTIYYPNENYVYIVNSSGSYSEKYIYQDGTLVAQVNSDGQKQAIHSDNKGSNTLITDSTGAVVENTFYSPYGEILSGGKSSRYGYEGKEYDSLVEKIDFKFRDYDPKIIIFGKPDDRIPNPYDPQQLNRYMFERANPYRFIDKKGHQLFQPDAVGGPDDLLNFISIHLYFIINYISGGKLDPPTVPVIGVGNVPIERMSAYTRYSTESYISAADKSISANPSAELSTEPPIIHSQNYYKNKDKEEEKKNDEELKLCEKCYKMLQVDEKGRAIIVTFNEKGQEVSRSSSGGGGPGGGSTVRETDDGRWVCNWCDDQGNEMPIEQD